MVIKGLRNEEYYALKDLYRIGIMLTTIMH